MQFKVPQNVQREDTIIGPVTMKQLIICALGGGIAYSIYVVWQKFYFWEVWIAPVGIVVAITATAAFLRIHDIPSYRFIFLLLEYALLPKKRMWIKGSGDVFISLLTPTAPKTRKDKKVQMKQETDLEKMDRLKELSNILDNRGRVNNPT